MNKTKKSLSVHRLMRSLWPAACIIMLVGFGTLSKSPGTFTIESIEVDYKVDSLIISWNHVADAAYYEIKSERSLIFPNIEFPEFILNPTINSHRAFTDKFYIRSISTLGVASDWSEFTLSKVLNANELGSTTDYNSIYGYFAFEQAYKFSLGSSTLDHSYYSLLDHVAVDNEGKVYGIIGNQLFQVDARGKGWISYLKDLPWSPKSVDFGEDNKFYALVGNELIHYSLSTGSEELILTDLYETDIAISPIDNTIWNISGDYRNLINAIDINSGEIIFSTNYPVDPDDYLKMDEIFFDINNNLYCRYTINQYNSGAAGTHDLLKVNPYTGQIQESIFNIFDEGKPWWGYSKLGMLKKSQEALLVSNKETIDFGKVTSDNSYHNSLIFKNLGKENLVVNKISYEQTPQFDIEFDQSTASILKPSSSFTINITFNAIETGTFETELLIEYTENDEDKTITIPVTGMSLNFRPATDGQIYLANKLGEIYTLSQLYNINSSLTGDYFATPKLLMTSSELNGFWINSKGSFFGYWYSGREEFGDETFVVTNNNIFTIDIETGENLFYDYGALIPGQGFRYHLDIFIDYKDRLWGLIDRSLSQETWAYFSSQDNWNDDEGIYLGHEANQMAYGLFGTKWISEGENLFTINDKGEKELRHQFESKINDIFITKDDGVLVLLESNKIQLYLYNNDFATDIASLPAELDLTYLAGFNIDLGRSKSYIYPNPGHVNDIINIETTNTIRDINIYNLSGIKEDVTVNYYHDQDESKAIVSGLSSGIKLIQIQTDEFTEVNKLIILE